MAIFQDVNAQAHACRAVDTALALLGAANGVYPEGGEGPLSIQMGINSGVAFVGSTRFERLRGTRWTFTASGHVTNLAARLAAAATPGQILASPETGRRIGDRYRLERLGRDRLKNLAEAVELDQIHGAT